MPSDPLGWERDKRTLRDWFHAGVRAPEEPSLCAYCDGLLGTQSPLTIDHFLPISAFPLAALDWHNLFPACVECNSTHKRARYHREALRPDRDPVEQWVEFDAEDGRLRPDPRLDERTRARIRLSFMLFGLNRPRLRLARRRRWAELRKHADADDLQLDRREGPYRFIADLVAIVIVSETLST